MMLNELSTIIRQIYMANKYLFSFMSLFSYHSAYICIYFYLLICHNTHYHNKKILNTAQYDNRINAFLCNYYYCYFFIFYLYINQSLLRNLALEKYYSTGNQRGQSRIFKFIAWEHSNSEITYEVRKTIVTFHIKITSLN